MLSTFLCDVRQIGHACSVRNMYTVKRPLIYDNAQLKHCVGSTNRWYSNVLATYQKLFTYRVA